MLRQMERSAIHVMAKRGKSIRQIAEEMGRSPTTISRVLREPLDQPSARRRRRSQVDPYREQIEQWLDEGLPVVRMLELARSDPEQAYTGSRSQFGEVVRGLANVNIEGLLIATGQNLKRWLAKRGWGRRAGPSGSVAGAFHGLATFGGPL